MRARLERWIEFLRTGFWFVPTLMLLASAALALILLYVDEHYDPGVKSAIAWAYSGGPEGARSLLSTIAGSMITAASVTFSLASVALSLASQQYGSRVLRNFMRDRATQLLLGTFISTFTYSVLVVRAIRGTDISGGFVPAISVTIAIVLALASLVALVYFIHHITTSIQASQIVGVIALDMGKSIPKLYPSETGDPLDTEEKLRQLRGSASVQVCMEHSGYLETIDIDDLLELATQKDLVFDLLVKPGDFLLIGQPVADVRGAESLDKATRERLLDGFYLGGERTPAQDIRYQFQQLTDVVVRALSPGINDPFTAMNGIDQLTSGAMQLARRSRVASRRQDESGCLRLLVETTSIEEVLEATVGHIAIYAAQDRFVMDRLRRMLSAVEPELRTGEERARVALLRAELDGRQAAADQ